MVLWVLFRVPTTVTTTHFNKMCCWMVLWVATPTTPYNNTCCWNVLLYGVVGVVSSTHNNKCVVVGTRNNTHNTIQQHILTKCVVVGTRNNTHNTIQQHTLLKCVVVGTRNNTHNTIQQHILLKCVVVGTRSNTIQQHTLLMLLLCVTYDDVGVVSSTHSLHPHHFVVVVCHQWWCGCCFEYPQFTPTSL